MPSTRREPATSRIAQVLMVVGVLSTAASCRDNVGPGPFPSPPQQTPLLETLTEWNAADPASTQRGRFYYTNGLLTRYEFGPLINGTHTITYYAQYEYSGSLLSRSEVYVRDARGAFRLTSESRYTYDASQRLVDRYTQYLDDFGLTRQHTATYEYNGSGLPTSVLVTGVERRELTYDDAGNLKSQEVALAGSPPLIYNYTYETSFNPLAGLPPKFDRIVLMTEVGFGPYNMGSWTARIAGGPVTSSAKITYELNEDRYPVLRVMTVNTAGSQSVKTLVSQFTYVK